MQSVFVILKVFLYCRQTSTHEAEFDDFQKKKKNSKEYVPFFRTKVPTMFPNSVRLAIIYYVFFVEFFYIFWFNNLYILQIATNTWY